MQIRPGGWLNTTALLSSKPKVYVQAKQANRQWELAAWMMVIALSAEAANSSFWEGAVWWASLMSVQELKFIYLLTVWLNCSSGTALRKAVVYLTIHYPIHRQSLYLVSNIFPVVVGFAWDLRGTSPRSAEWAGTLEESNGLYMNVILHFPLRWFFSSLYLFFCEKINWCWKGNKAELYFFLFMSRRFLPEWNWQETGGMLAACCKSLGCKST